MAIDFKIRVLTVAARISFAFCLLIVMQVFQVDGQQQGDRDLNRVKSTGPGRESDSLFAESHAIVFGVSDYSNGLKPLPGVKNDIEEVRRALEKHGFKVRVVMNPTQPEFDRVMREVISRHGLARDNRLLIYFAGHGHTIGARGYLVPVNAPHPDDDEPGFINAAISFDMIQVYARMIRSNMAMFVFDSCFSGSLFDVRGSFSMPPPIASIAGLPIRQFIASGSANQTVPDKSIFRQQFIEALEGAADIPPRDGFITGTELGLYLHRMVTTYTANENGMPMQTPQYGKLRDPDYDKGEFIFSYQRSDKFADEPVSDIPRPQTIRPAESAGTWKLTRDQSIPIFANQDWAATGINLQSGQEVRIAATGQISLGRGIYSGPEGVYNPDPVKPAPECRLGSLIGRIGTGKPMCFGADFKTTVSSSGELFLSINEGSRRDNSRSILVQIRVFNLVK